jgi:hypothetical protein
MNIVLSLIALCFLYWNLSWWCYKGFFVNDHWRLDCVAREIGYYVGIPLATALVAGYLKKSRPVFWNVFVGAFVIVPVAFFFVGWL